MATGVVTGPEAARPRPLPIHRFTVAQYHRMIQTGVLTENDRVELLEGLIVDKMPQHPAHSGTISVLLARLQAKLPKAWMVRVQSPVTLEDSEPEPDLAVVRGPEDRYMTAHPTPEDIALVVEVSDTTIDHDQGPKARAYARAGIPVYWIVNLPEVKVEVYTDPKPGKAARYQTVERLGIEYGVTLTVGGRKVGGIPIRYLFP